MENPNPYQSPSGSDAPRAAPRRPQPGTSLDFNRCFAFFFQDPDWVKKLLVGSLFSLLSAFFIGSFFVAGYMMRIIGRSSRGESRPLPEWDDLGGIFVEGAGAVGTSLIYLLPAIALVVPFGLGIAALSGVPDEASAAMAGLSVLFMMVFLLAILAIMLFVPAALTRLAVERRFGAAFEIQEIFDFVKRNLSNYLLAMLTFLLVNFLSQFGLILFCIGIVPASFWATCVGAYALGEVAFRDQAQGAPAMSTSA